ncbi:MAG: FecR domain-containing protein [Bacteroidales bacterium]|nr:FecR domain-containing protein [Bacteroidales bacterium]
MNEKHYDMAALIAREQIAELSGQERAILDAWKRENPELYRRCIDAEMLKEKAALCGEFPLDKGWKRLQNAIDKDSRRHSIGFFMKYAAVILLPIAVAVGILLTTHGGSQVDFQQESICTRMAVTETSLGENASVTLSDGTFVQLNSLSRLEYPEEFDGEKRVVKLYGEAYFDVAKSDIPFIVETANMEVEVLGTLFNLSAYAGEESSATLVSGSVKVSAAGQESILKPSQQAFVNPSEMLLRVQEVDTRLFTSWRDGKIIFKDKPLEHILTKLSHWYDFSATFDSEEIKQIRFGCSVNRYDDIESFVELLVETGRVKVKKEGNNYHFYI